MLIELQINGKVEQIELEDEAKAQFELIAKDRGISFDDLMTMLLTSACADTDKELGLK